MTLTLAATLSDSTLTPSADIMTTKIGMLLTFADRQNLMHGHGIVLQAPEVAATQLTSMRQSNTFF